MSGRAAGWILAGVAAACATKGSVRRVETQVAVLRVETARQDSARAAELARIIRLQGQVLDSLATTRFQLRILDAKLGNDLTEVLRQLLAVQEITGQSQRRLSELKAQLDSRAETPVVAAPGDTVAAGVPPTPASADQMYQGALQQYGRGSLVSARRAFQDFLASYAGHPLVPDALYYIGQTFDPAEPDSAVAKYNEVVTRFPQSSRAPTSLFKIGLLAERRGDAAAARATFQRVIDRYPRSEEADLARDRVANPKP